MRKETRFQPWPRPWETEHHASAASTASRAPRPAPQDPHVTRLQRQYDAVCSMSAVIKGDENQQCHKRLWNPLVRLCTHVGVHICVFTSKCECMWVSVFAHVCCGSLMFICSCVYTCACVYTRVHVCSCACVCTCAHMCLSHRNMQGLPF